MTDQAVSRINKILSTFENSRYLEVGVFKGGTFFGVEAARKVAVDPKFQFPIPQNRNESRFHEVYSDVFFESLDSETRFDVIFLDGLHTFEQTFRDFCNSLRHIQSGSVIILDDTVPNDPYSAHRDQIQAVKAREESGNRSRSWHGDTFKVVLAIHDYFPWLSYATVMDDGNPQTVVWIEPRKSSPAFDRVEQIGHADFFTFRENFSLFNPVSKEELEIILSRHLGSKVKSPELT